jgi:hypothetical protein
MIHITNAVYLEIHTFVSPERISEFFFANDPAVCCCMPLPLDANSFKNVFSTAKELVYSVFDEKSYARET